jgi:hypothetical protein
MNYQPTIHIGVDLGQRRDHTAIAVVEKFPISRTESGLLVRYVERIALGTPYAHIAERLRRLATHPQLAGRCAMAIDATGLGGPVVEMLRSYGLGCDVTAVTITNGAGESGSGHDWSVPKRDLMSGLQVGLESGEVRIARHMQQIESLVRELVSIRATAMYQGHLRIGAEGSGHHDDLVLALAVWKGRRKVRFNSFGGEGRLF